MVVPSGIEVDKEFSKDTVFSSHPLITEASFDACDRLIHFIKQTAPQKVTVLLSGGSSALIEKSNNPGNTSKINEMLLKSGKNILEINSIRSNNSLIKNGKLAQMFPEIKWQVFVMSDIPFENGEKMVGSMPFFREDLTHTSLFKCADSDTLHDHILSKINNASSIRNFTGSVSELSGIIQDFINNDHLNLLVTGEPLLKTDISSYGSGGRMTHLALTVLPNLKNTMRLYALSSDGIDGNSDLAGAVIENVSGGSFNISEIETALKNYDSAAFLRKEGMGLKSGYTGMNLNDFVILLKD
jgi:glycerate 2-kinase